MVKQHGSTLQLAGHGKIQFYIISKLVLNVKHHLVCDI